MCLYVPYEVDCCVLKSWCGFVMSVIVTIIGMDTTHRQSSLPQFLRRTTFDKAADACPPKTEDDAEAIISRALPSQHRCPRNKNIITAARIQGIHYPRLCNYLHPSLPDWNRTSLPGPLSLSQAHYCLIACSNDADGTTLPMTKFRKVSRSFDCSGGGDAGPAEVV